jgi:hypothetical protein
MTARLQDRMTAGQYIMHDKRQFIGDRFQGKTS